MGFEILPVAAVGAVLVAFVYYRNSFKSSLPLPPGPRGLPLLGNALELGKVADGAFWLKFAEYADQHGPIVTVSVLHQRHIVVSDPQLAFELFEKRGSNYSDRRISEMTKLARYTRTIAMLQYGPTLKWYRALLQQHFNPRASKDYLPVHYHETRKFIKRLLVNPKDFLLAARLMSSSVFLRVAYGHEVKSVDDIFVRNAALGTAAFSETMQPTRWVVDMLPILRYLPAWFPLATFHRRAKQIYEMESAHRELPFQDLEKRISEGTAKVCFASKLLNRDDGAPVDPETQEHIKYLTSSVYSGAAGGATSSLESFFLAMTLYPDVQAKAQEEIDAYMEQYTKGSRSQMILFEDRENLPYTSALVHEVYRWHPPINAVAHQSRNEDELYIESQKRTYRIPARSFIIVNMWKMMHDPEVYEQPDRFMPERYLVENPPPEPESYAFGFGRRICPGVTTSKHMLFIAMSNILANFTIGKAKDERGLDITPEERYSSDLTSHPFPFQCEILPRQGSEEWLRDENEVDY